MTTKAQKTATAKYQAANMKKYTFKFNVKTEGDLIAHLESIDNVQGYIKALVRADMLKKNNYLRKGENAMKMNDLHKTALSLKETADSLLLSIREAQRDIETKYNAEHAEPFNGFDYETTDETESISCLDCAFAHLADAIANIEDCISFIVATQN